MRRIKKLLRASNSNFCKPIYPDPDSCAPCKPLHPVPSGVILACGTGCGVILPEHDEKHSQLENPYAIASVTIDTTCLCKPTIKLDFSTLIMFRENDGDDLRLTFRLSKTSSEGQTVYLNTWNFERDFDFAWRTRAAQKEDESSSRSGMYIDAETVDSFCFTFCECNTCPGCYVYTVEIINAETEGVDCVAVTNSMINAIAASSC